MNFTCRMGIVGQVAAAVPNAPIMVPVKDGTKRSLADVFRDASLGGNPPTPGIELSFDDSPLANRQKSDAEIVDFGILEDALNVMVNNPAGQPVSQIGILYANTMRGHEDAYGVMFDEQFLGAPAAVGYRPREGCAIFLDTIAQGMPDKVSYQKQRGYTTAHEVAHIFNQHHTTSACYLRRSIANQPPDDDACTFITEQEKAFARCGTEGDTEIAPGTSPFVGEGDDRPRPASARAPHPWVLTVAMPEEFRPFEPMDLIVSLGLRPKVRSRTIRQALHSGYGQLAIWIEDPAGEVRRYRPTGHFCGDRGEASISPGRPLVEAVRIFGQAGGYTFRRPGVHRIWATYQLSPATRLRSRSITVNVLGVGRHSRAVRHQLTDQTRLLQQGARTLFYRSAKLAKPELQALSHFLETYRDTTSTPAIHHAIGASLTSHLFATKSTKRPTARQISRAENHLCLAAEHTFCRASANRLLETLAELKKPLAGPKRAGFTK